MMKRLLQHVLILIALVAISSILPIASFWLIRDPLGAQVVFWASPWVVAFWSLIAYVLVGSRFWRGKFSVEEWKSRHGCYIWRAAKNTMWMFAALAFSYAAELAFIFLVPPSSTAMRLFPLVTYSPFAFTLLWSAARG